MGFLVCEKCGGYYKLQSGESPDDFEECQCGGRLKYYKYISDYIRTEDIPEESKNHEKTLVHDKKDINLRNIAREVYGADFRENQKHFFKFFRENKHQNIIADAPTGSGKSLIAMQIAINLELPGTVFIVTPTKDLMKQYERDFGHLEDVMLLAGKNEYKCKDDTDLTAEHCTHRLGNPCEHHYNLDKEDSCEYSKKISTFMDYKVVITNYHMMLALIKIRSALQWGSPLIIWDESHKFQDIIREMTGIEYNHTRALRILMKIYQNVYITFLRALKLMWTK
jgi:Rad3-related DNA helicase